MAAASEGEVLCDRALSAMRTELADTKQLLSAEKKLTQLATRQRDEAIKARDDARPFLDWYAWTLIGAAVSAILIKGVTL